MMKRIVSLVLLFGAWNCTFAQNIIIQQNNGQTSQTQEKVVEKVVEKPVFIPVDPPKPKSPVCLYGYLYVYPEDLGDFYSYPSTVIANINKNKVHGKSHWRLPTKEELALMEENSAKINLRTNQGGYCHSYHMYWTEGMGPELKNYCGPCPIRLVCTE